jgi:hypothetical protein
MAEVNFKTIVQPAPGCWLDGGTVAWKWEIYVEGDEAPVSIGWTVGTRAEADADVLKAQRLLLDGSKGHGQ